MRRLLTVVLAGLLVVLSASPAMASTSGQIYEDCQDDGQLSGDYSPSQLRDALKNMPSDVREYSDCADVIRRAELPTDPTTNTTGGGTTTPTVPTTGSGVTPPPTGGAPVTTAPAPGPQTAQDKKALGDAQNAGTAPVTVLDKTVIPVAAGIPGGEKSSSLPGGLVVALVLLALAGIALAVPPIKRRLKFTLPTGLSRS